MSDYTTIADLRAFVLADPTDTTRDGQLTPLITVASRAVDQYCSTQFYADSQASARAYSSKDRWTVLTDDLSSSTITVAVDTDDDGIYETALTSKQFFVDPAYDGRPYSIVRATSYPYPASYWLRPTVQITGTWGWPAVPVEVATATLLLASRLWERRKSPSGVMGFADLTGIRLGSVDPDVASLLSPYMSPNFA